MRIGFVQHAIIENAPEQTAENLWRILTRLARSKPQLIILPEVFLGGTKQLADMSRFATLHRQFLGRLATFSATHHASIYGSVIEERRGQYFNSAVFISPEGWKTVYRKNHLFRFEGEHRLFGSGSSDKPFSTPWGKVAPQICYDIRFPELLRTMVFRGAQLALISAQWPASRREHWLTLLRARAIENQIFILACNRTGQKGALTYSGDSCAISPWGEIKLCLPETRESGLVDIDLKDIARVRKAYPFLKDAVRERIRFDF